MLNTKDHPHGEDTDQVDECGNHGCAANEHGKCIMTFVECFGYILPSKNKEQETPCNH